MKVSKDWLQELVDLNCSLEELVDLLPLRTIGIKEVTDNFIELDMKGYNRADLLSMRGVALEVAAITNSNVKFSDDAINADKISRSAKFVSKLNVKVEDTTLAPIYCIARIENLEVEHSNENWVKKLSSCGIRAINNIADVTNLIMLEYGQPMHAFDARAVKDETIIVRTAKKGERITTLDGKTRDLDTADLLIADSQSPLGIAGVMGGKDSEINDSTTTILLEAAIFDPVNIKKTVTSLALPSEASKRFQHGLTKKRLLQALNAAIKMYEQLGGKVTAVTMVGNFEDKVKSINLTKKKLEDLVGIKFEPKQVEDYLKRLGAKLYHPEGGLRSHLQDWVVEMPYFRLDVNIEEDVIEEAARMYGYEKIPASRVSESKHLQREDPIFKTISDLKNKLVKERLTEMQTYSFYSTQIMAALGWDNEKEKLLVKIANPISAETQYLRQAIWPNLLEVMGKNLRRGFKDIAVFEIGKAFNNIDGTPSEDYRLAVALCNETDNPAEELISIFRKLGMDVELKETHPPAVVKDLFHPKRFLAIKSRHVKLPHTRHVHTQIGGLAEVHLRVLNKLGIEKRVAVLEIEL